MTSRRPGLFPKKLVAGISLLTSAALLAACGGNKTDEATDKKPVVLTTFTILEDMTKQVGGDLVDVHSLTSPGAEIHGYEPTPSDVATASKADLILSNGLGLEHWVGKLLENSKAKRAEASEGITPINIEGTNTPNPHAWMSPTNAVMYVDNIEKSLVDLRPEHKDKIHENADRYRNELKKVDAELHKGLEALPRQSRTLVSCEGAFSYLTRDAKMKEGYIWPVNTEEEATPQQVARTINFVRDNKVPAVFCESTVNEGGKQQVIRETGAKDGGTLYVDSLSDASGPVPSYLELLRHDVSTIVTGLNSDKKPGAK